ncbi:MAG TPA: RNA methyltransferase [Bacteroidales bacterium]|nr:RNA methyltransferase [Bacteroidales bacterium]
MRKLTTEELNRLSVENFKASPKLPVVLVLDQVRSHFNVGSVFRTADAFRAEAIHLCGITGTPPHREIHKTALGATDSVHWEYYPSTKDSLSILKKKGYRIFAVEQTDASIPLQKFDPGKTGKIALVFGNEVRGIEEEALAMTEGSIEIPQYGTKHSLNLSVTAGIVLWEMLAKLKFLR